VISAPESRILDHTWLHAHSYLTIPHHREIACQSISAPFSHTVTHERAQFLVYAPNAPGLQPDTRSADRVRREVKTVHVPRYLAAIRAWSNRNVTLTYTSV